MERIAHTGKLSPQQFNRAFIETLSHASNPLIGEALTVYYSLNSDVAPHLLEGLYHSSKEGSVFHQTIDRLRTVGLFMANDRPMPLLTENGILYFDLDSTTDRPHLTGLPAAGLHFKDVLVLEKDRYQPKFTRHLTDYQFSLALITTPGETFAQGLSTIHGYTELIQNAMSASAQNSDRFYTISDSEMIERMGLLKAGLLEGAEDIQVYRKAMEYLERQQLMKQPIPLRDQGDKVVLDLMSAASDSAFQQFIPGRAA